MVGETCIVSSIAAMEGCSSSIGESSAVALIYLGVRASDDAGGDMYCSTPISMGNVWLRGRWKFPLPGWPRACWFPINGFDPQAESGVKKGDESEVGLVGPAENDEGAVSVNTLESDVLLCEWNGRRVWVNSCGSGLSVFRFSLLGFAETLRDEGDTPLGDAGEIPPGVWTLDGGFDVPSDSSAMELFLDLAPMRLFFCLNFSSQLVLLALRWVSELPTVLAKKRAFSRMIPSVSGRPCRW